MDESGGTTITPYQSGDAQISTWFTRSQLSLAALAEVDQSGIEGASLAGVARRLGCPPGEVTMVINTDQLLDLAAEAVYGEVDFTTDERMWTERTRSHANSFRRALLRHPNAAPLIATRPAVSLETVRVGEEAMREFVAVGFDSGTAGRILTVIVSFVVGHALNEIGGSRPDLGGHHPDDVQVFRDDLPESEVPIAAGAGPRDRDAEFNLGLELLVKGLERQLLHAAPQQ